MIHYFKSKTEICKRFRFLFLALALSTLFYACLPVKKNIVRPSINDLGIQIKKHRIKRGYTVKQLAKAVKISEQNLNINNCHSLNVINVKSQFSLVVREMF